MPGISSKNPIIETGNTMLNKVTIKAPAKINLTLDVIGKRENGYHDLRMIMQTIDLCDELTIIHTGSPQITLTMDKELPDKIAPEQNLVYKAAKLMQEEYQLPYGFDIQLKKNIPAAAGLAGGSADCAATLLGINHLCGLSLDKEELCDLGVTLGADVPFCIKQGTMLAEGIGEILTPLPDLPPLWTVLIKPDFPISTAHVYQRIDHRHPSYHPDTSKAVDAISRRDVITLAQNLSNVLEAVTFEEHIELADIKEFFHQNGAIGALMSGSGPTMYGLYQDEILARIAYKTAVDKFPEYEVIICQTRLPKEDNKATPTQISVLPRF